MPTLEKTASKSPDCVFSGQFSQDVTWTSSSSPSLSATSWAMSTSTPIGVLSSVAWKDSGMEPAVVATVSLPSLPISSGTFAASAVVLLGPDALWSGEVL